MEPMALAQAPEPVLSAVLETASLMWMEFAMFATAAFVYALWAGGPQKPCSDAASNCRVPREDAAKKKGHARKDHTTSEEHHAVLRKWQRVKVSVDATLKLSLTQAVDSMRKLGKSTDQIVSELRSALDANAGLLPQVSALANSLLRDDSVELLSATIRLLDERGHGVDANVYAGLIGAQLRRRDYASVAETAALFPSDALTPKVRAILATAAAHRHRLDEALGQLRQIPVAAERGRCPMAPGSVAALLGLAACEGRVLVVLEELQRLDARMEPRHLDELLGSEKCRRSPVAVKQLFAAATALQVKKGQPAYQALAVALAQSSDSVGLRSLVEELEAEAERGSSGTPVGEPLALKLLDACRAAQEGELVTRVARLHKAACAGAPGTRALSAVCGALAASQCAEAACDFFEAEMEPQSLWPEVGHARSLAKAAAQVGRAALAQRLSDHLDTLSRSVGAGAPGGNSELQRAASLIKAHARDRNLAAAGAVLQKLQAGSAVLSPLVYNCYLDACAHCGDVEAALEHFEEMKRLQLADVVGYNTMLKVYLYGGRAEDARALMAEMSEQGLQANKVTYNELLHAKVIANDRKGMWRIVEEMRMAGVKASSVTCSILLKSLTESSCESEIKKIIDLMEEIEETIDEVLFASVIEACIRIRQLALLTDIMRRHKAKGGLVKLTAPTYGSMIKAYGQAGDVARVSELWLEMEERSVKPTSITLGCMTEALVVNGEAEEALMLLHKQLESEERRACINTVIYSTVLKGFAVSKNINKVFAVYKEMRDSGYACNTITYNTLLDACAKCCAMSRAPSLLEDMKASCVEPDIITYSTIVKGYCLEGDVDRAFCVLEDMKSDGKFAPDEIMYNSILDGCARQRRVDDSLRVLEEMKSAGVGPSNYTLSILVKLLGHARRLPQAFRLVEDLSRQNGFRPNVQVYTCLVQACVLNRRLEKALALHDEMMADAGCRVDEKFYAVLARGCLQMRNPLKAAEVVRAAYRLDGHNLALPARKNPPVVGVEARTLEEVGGCLQEGCAEERDEFNKLCSDLWEKRGVWLTACGRGAGGGSGRRVGDGGGNGRRAGTAARRG